MIFRGHHPCLDRLTPYGDIALRSQETDEGTVYWMGQAHVSPPAHSPWVEAEGIHVARTDLDTDRYLVPGAYLTHEVVDSQGTRWRAPCVLQAFPSEEISIDIPIGKNWQPQPSEEQQRLIDASRWMRKSLVDGCHGIGDTSDDRLQIHMDLEMAAKAAAEALAVLYAVTPDMVAALGVLDRTLIGQVMMTCAGMHPDHLAQIKEAADAI